MPIDVSHFTMVGFGLNTGNEASFSQSAEKMATTCQPSALSATDIVCLVSDPSGAELRIGLRRDSKGNASIMTMNPAFSGEGRTKLEVVSNVSDPAENPFEVTVSAHFSGEQTPVVFELADPLKVSNLVPGTSIAVDISAFSFEPKIFADEAAYLQSQKNSGSKLTFASNYFIPSGSFFEKAGGVMPDGASRPLPYADFAGKILKYELRPNTAGGGKFWWALVKTYDDATVDVVMDPVTVKLDPKVGEIISGRFWITADIIHGP